MYTFLSTPEEMIPKVETERLIIRPFELKDINDAYEMNLDEKVSRYTADGGIVSKEEIHRRITEDVMGDYQRYGYGRMAIEWKENHKCIGFTGLKYLADLQEVDLGYRLMSNFWGKGIATEAGKISLQFGFDYLKIERIIALVLPENKASIKVLKKLNFSFEKEIKFDGLNAHQYAIKQYDYYLANS